MALNITKTNRKVRIHTFIQYIYVFVIFRGLLASLNTKSGIICCFLESQWWSQIRLKWIWYPITRHVIYVLLFIGCERNVIKCTQHFSDNFCIIFLLSILLSISPLWSPCSTTIHQNTFVLHLLSKINFSWLQSAFRLLLYWIYSKHCLDFSKRKIFSKQPY